MRECPPDTPRKPFKTSPGRLAEALAFLRPAPEKFPAVQEQTTALARIKENPIVQALASIDAPAAPVVFSPKAIPTMKITTPRQVLELKRDTEAHGGKMSTFRVFFEENPVRTAALIRTHLIWLNAQCNVNKPLSEAQIDLIAETIRGDWQLMGLTVTDFMIVMRRAIVGEYGELFESLTPPKVLGWLKKYAEERAAVAGELSREAAVVSKSDRMDTRAEKERQAAREAEEIRQMYVRAYAAEVKRRQEKQNE